MSPIQEAIISGLIGGAIAAVSSIAAVLISIGRFQRLMKDFPPHAHINGNVYYPPGFKRGEIDKLDQHSAAAGAAR